MTPRAHRLGPRALRHAPIAALLVAASVVLLPGDAAAQHEHHAPATPATGWAWAAEARVFLSWNVQERKFRDFHPVESQNWLMLGATHALSRARLGLHAMFSAEDYTLSRYGSPQVFQTGETFEGAALVDYQHPHDVVMGAYARLDWPVGSRWRMHAEAGPVGAPAFGPVPFMHRASADPNPTAPLTHHHFDAMHVSRNVITLGASQGALTMEASAFSGREPDEDRLRIESGPIDSYAARVRWRRSGWDAQFSAAYLSYPDPTESTDLRRITASVSYAGTWRERPIAVTMAFGHQAHTAFVLNSPAWIAEGVWDWRPATRFYVRGEVVQKDILTHGGYDPPGFEHEHVLSWIGAATFGVDRVIAAPSRHRFSVGADATVYARDPNLDEAYGHPFSAHVFLRYAFRRD